MRSHNCYRWLTPAGGGTSLAAVSHLIEEGVTKLLDARGVLAGAAHQNTLLAGLRLLNIALETDVWLLQELRQHPAIGKPSLACCMLKC